MTRRKTALPVAVLVLGAFALLVLVFMVARGPRTAYDDVATLTWPRSFSPDAWASHPAQRNRMAGDLVRGGLLQAKTDAWLQRNLGAPSDESADDFRPSEYDYVRSWSAPTPMRPHEELVIWSRQGVVIGWSLTSDPEVGPQYPYPPYQ